MTQHKVRSPPVLVLPPPSRGLSPTYTRTAAATGSPERRPRRDTPAALKTGPCRSTFQIAELALNGLLLLGVGLAIGFLSGMFGIGGGFIMTPLLIFLGVPAGVAVGTGASQVMASSVSSAFGHWQRGNIDRQIGYLLIGGGVFGAITGVRILYALKQAGQPRVLRHAHLRDPARRDRLPDADREPAHARGRTRRGRARRAGPAARVDPGLTLERRFPNSKLYISAIPPVAIGALIAGSPPSWASAAASSWCRP